MIVPSIDLQHGHAVQLVGGRHRALDAGDPRPLATSFGRTGEVAVIDLDAATGEGSNRALVEELCRSATCRVGGGIRDYESAVKMLDAGAARVIIGTAATPDLLRRLPRDRVIAALDGIDGEVVVDGWRTRTGTDVLAQMRALRGSAGGFLVTFVEHEGRLGGLPAERVQALRAAAGGAELTVAGGVRDVAEIADLDKRGVDVQVGMALYTGRITLAGALWSMLASERPDGLVPTLVCDELGTSLGLAWSSRASLAAALAEGAGIYESRRRGLWRKGAESGNVQDLLSVQLDCDRDALRFIVRQHGSGFCHEGTETCFGDPLGLRALERTLAARARAAPPGSYTQRLLESPALLAAKLIEEANELAAAEQAAEVRHEAADVLYFTMVAMQRAGVRLADVARELETRARRVTRRPGDAKPEFAS